MGEGPVTNARVPKAANTVLIVDDSELTCESVKATLEDAGFRVLTLNGPFGFIKCVHESRPGVILIDVGLGTMNGTKLVRLARDHTAPLAKILLYSGRTNAELERDVTESGADGFISKSISNEEFVASVKTWATRPW
jgi:DNA-binding response OmpR family regulator